MTRRPPWILVLVRTVAARIRAQESDRGTPSGDGDARTRVCVGVATRGDTVAVYPDGAVEWSVTGTWSGSVW